MLLPLTSEQAMLASATSRDPMRPDLSTLTIIGISPGIDSDAFEEALTRFAEECAYATFRVHSTNAGPMQGFGEESGRSKIPCWSTSEEIPLSTEHPTVRLAASLPWTLKDEPPIRFVVRVASSRVVEVALVMHHIIADGACHLNLARKVARWLLGIPEQVDVEGYLQEVLQSISEQETMRASQTEYWEHRIREWDLDEHSPSALSEPGEPTMLEAAEHRARGLLRDPAGITSSNKQRAWVRAVDVAAEIYEGLAVTTAPDALVWIATSTRTRRRSSTSHIDLGYFVNMLPLLDHRRRKGDDEIDQERHWRRDLSHRLVPSVDVRHLLWEAMPAPRPEIYLTVRPDTAQGFSEVVSGQLLTFDLLQPYFSALDGGSIRLAQTSDGIDLQTDGPIATQLFPWLTRRLKARLHLP